MKIMGPVRAKEFKILIADLADIYQEFCLNRVMHEKVGGKPYADFVPTWNIILRSLEKSYLLGLAKIFDKQFLKIDFPRVSYPENKKEFDRLAELGKELRLLHLMESDKLNRPITTYNEVDGNEVEKIEYKDGNVFINKKQYFGGVPEIAWNFYIGGYQPAQKWLKDRKGRQLTSEEIEHYQKIIVVLIETDRIMKEIDQIFVK